MRRAILIGLVLFAMLVCLLPLAVAGGGDYSCQDGPCPSCHKIEFGEGQETATWTAPAGTVINQVDIKAGTVTYAFTVDGTNGCYTVTGIGTQMATATRTGIPSNTCKAVSHAIFHYGCQSTPTLAPSLTPTETETPTEPTPTNTPTEPAPTPTQTSTPTEEPTPMETVTPPPGPRSELVVYVETGWDGVKVCANAEGADQGCKYTAWSQDNPPQPSVNWTFWGAGTKYITVTPDLPEELRAKGFVIWHWLDVDLYEVVDSVTVAVPAGQEVKVDFQFVDTKAPGYADYVKQFTRVN